MDPALHKLLDRNVTYETNHLNKWVKPDINLKLVQEWIREIEQFIDDPHDPSIKRMVCSAVEHQYHYHLQHYLHHVLRETIPVHDHLGWCALYNYWGHRMMAALIKTTDGGGMRFLFCSAFFALANVATAGWEQQAQSLGRDLLDSVRLDRMNLFGRKRGAQLVLKAYKTWQKIDEVFEDENSIDAMDGFAHLVEDIAHPDPQRFAVALDTAADYHVSQSFHDSSRRLSAIPQSAYWLFPTELFAVFRIRQWMGLELPELIHPLFKRTPVGRLPEPRPMPHDELLDQALRVFAQVTGTLELDEANPQGSPRTGKP